MNSFDLSPEEVSGWLNSMASTWYIRADRRNGGDLYTHLRQAHKKRRNKYGSKDKRRQICNWASIDQHTDIVDEKSRIGDLEINTVIGQNHKGALMKIVERKSNFTLMKN